MNNIERNRIMRILVFFDLPVITEKDKREYRRFRKFLTGEGYIMMQESVYSRLSLTDAQAAYLIRRLEHNKPPKGLVQVLRVTERQFASIILLVGELKSQSYLGSTDRLIIL